LSEDLNILRVCALLHDIGKPECWANEKSWSQHIHYTYKFVKSCLGEKLALHAMRHHTGRWYSPSDYPQDSFERIIALADNLASGADRPEETIPEGPKPRFPIGLTHVLSGGNIIRSSFDKAHLAFISRGLVNNLKKPCSEFSEDPKKAYFKIFEIMQDSDLKLIPADTRRPVNDVSLWDHLKLTAALSTCILLGGGYIGDDPRKYSFALISGDADKISRFINVSSRLPDLYARSDIIKKATANVVNAISDVLGPECILYAAGGSFLALSPIRFMDKALKKAKEEFENSTKGRVTLTTSHVQTNGDEIRKKFGEVWQRAQRNMRIRKSERMIIPTFSVDEGVNVCDICLSEPWRFEDQTKILKIDASPRPERLCDFCWELREYGRRAKHIEIDKLGENSGYVGLLKADGDDMGAILSGRKFKHFNKANTPSRLSTLSDIIHTTCEREFEKVISDYNGEIVYSGGDDLLALLPGENSLEAAKKVNLKFREAMAKQCTLSAGVAIFHYSLPIYAALEVGSYLLGKVKENGKNRVAFAVIGGTGITESELKKVETRRWEELEIILEIADFMGKGLRF